MKTLKTLLLTAVLGASASPVLAQSVLGTSLTKAAPKANPNVVQLAVDAMNCAVAHGEPQAKRLAVIDYSLPSTKPRMWVFDTVKGTLLYEELVAHGRGTGENYATRFSNTVDSHKTSIGLFRTMDSYTGRNGYSLRMAGLEDTNNRALERAIVIHGAPYVSTSFAKQQGRLGRSHGCPAVRQDVARPLIDTLKGGHYVFSYYPDQKWLATSPFVNCTGGLMAGASKAKAVVAAR